MCVHLVKAFFIFSSRFGIFILNPVTLYKHTTHTHTSNECKLCAMCVYTQYTTTDKRRPPPPTAKPHFAFAQSPIIYDKARKGISYQISLSVSPSLLLSPTIRHSLAPSCATVWPSWQHRDASHPKCHLLRRMFGIHQQTFVSTPVAHNTKATMTAME